MRSSFTHEQVLKLQKVFQKKKYLGNRERTELAHALKMTEQQIKIWFQNRRYKEKKQLKRSQEMKPLCSTFRSFRYKDLPSSGTDFESHVDIKVEECNQRI